MAHYIQCKKVDDAIHIVDLFFKELHKDGKSKAEYVRKLREKVKANIGKKVESYVKQANKGRKQVVFDPGGWVWVHLRKEGFLALRKSKLPQRGEGDEDSNLRTNSSEERGNDEDIGGGMTKATNLEDLEE